MSLESLAHLFESANMASVCEKQPAYATNE